MGLFYITQNPSFRWTVCAGSSAFCVFTQTLLMVQKEPHPTVMVFYSDTGLIKRSSDGCHSWQATLFKYLNDHKRKAPYHLHRLLCALWQCCNVVYWSVKVTEHPGLLTRCKCSFHRSVGEDIQHKLDAGSLNDNVVQDMPERIEAHNFDLTPE